jgi:DNA-binding FadR family transcriptional regulator
MQPRSHEDLHGLGVGVATVDDDAPPSTLAGRTPSVPRGARRRTIASVNPGRHVVDHDRSAVSEGGDEIDSVGGVSRLPNAFAWEPIGGSRASERVIDQIRKSFFSGMRPGDWIGTESALAKTFGVSRLTMRDAIRKLETCGMVEVKVGVGGGLRVARPTPDRFAEALAVQLHLDGQGTQDVTEAVSALDPVLARIAADRRSPEQLAQIERVVAEHRRVVDDPNAFARSASAFHVVVALASNNTVLSNVVRAMSFTTERLCDISGGGKRGVEATIEAHESILRAIVDQDGARAASVMERHVCTNEGPRVAAG